MKFSKKYLIGALALLGLAGVAIAQPVITQVSQINTNDLIQIIPRGIPSAQSVYAPATLFGNYSQTLAGNNFENAIIGGDATTNLFQRGTTGSSVTTTITYGGPDRWAYWSGTSTAMTVSKTTTAADLPASNNYQAGFKMARTSGQTGVVQVCMMQEVESANSFAFAGQTAEIDFHATAGANFSAANSAMTVYLISGTATDEGVAKAAFNLNAGGGGSSQWTGQVNTGVNVTIGTVNQRYSVAIPVPSGAQELGVALCFTPVGTAGTNDYIAFSGIQMVRNSALTTVAGTAGVALNVNDPRAKAFARRSQGLETALQQRYTYSVNEGTITAGALMGPVGQAPSATTCATVVPFPVTMRVAPTYANALTASTFKLNAAAANVALSTPFSATTGANTVNNGSVTFTASGLGATAGFGCYLVSAAGSGQMLFSAEF